MSAILELIEAAREEGKCCLPDHWTSKLADAAGAEMKALENEGAALRGDRAAAEERERQARFLIERLQAQLAERDQADAELRETLELYKSHDCGHEHLIGAVYKWAAKGAVK